MKDVLSIWFEKMYCISSILAELFIVFLVANILIQGLEEEYLFCQKKNTFMGHVHLDIVADIKWMKGMFCVLVKFALW